MTDMRVDGMGEEDRLPWLEPVEEEDEGSEPSAFKLIAAVIVGLVLIGLVVGGAFWLRDGGTGESGELIAAPEGDYKVKPENPGGMEVEGAGDTAYAASEGQEPKGRLNVNAVPEAPVTKGAEAQPQPKVQPQPKTPPQPKAEAAEPQPEAVPGGTVQLGAFSSQAAANRAWSALSERFGYLAPLSHNIVPVETGGRTLYRLRASGADAAGICRRLQIAGEACVVVD